MRKLLLTLLVLAAGVYIVNGNYDFNHHPTLAHHQKVLGYGAVVEVYRDPSLPLQTVKVVCDFGSYTKTYRHYQYDDLATVYPKCVDWR